MTSTPLDAVTRHYTPPDLAGAVTNALRALGKDNGPLDSADLAPLDQFHTGGRKATLELAQLAGVVSGMRVLDIGGGLGGPARTLAGEFGCEVTVLDLSPGYTTVGALLTGRTGLAGKVRFVTGNALALPFAETSFDLVWMQHCSMNIEDKPRLFAGVHRVLRPGGRLALHEVAAGPHPPIHLPVPWASAPEQSVLRPAPALRRLIADQGLEERLWRDVSAAALDWFRARLAAMPATPPPLGLHLLLGDRLRPALENLARNLEEERVAVVQAVFERPLHL